MYVTKQFEFRFSLFYKLQTYIRNKKPVRTQVQTAEFLGNEDTDKERIKMVCPGEKEESFTVKFQRNDPRYFLIKVPFPIVTFGGLLLSRDRSFSSPEHVESFLGHVVLLQIKLSGSGDENGGLYFRVRYYCENSHTFYLEKLISSQKIFLITVWVFTDTRKT